MWLLNEKNLDLNRVICFEACYWFELSISCYCFEFITDFVSSLELFTVSWVNSVAALLRNRKKALSSVLRNVNGISFLVTLVKTLYKNFQQMPLSCLPSIVTVDTSGERQFYQWKISGERERHLTKEELRRRSFALNALVHCIYILFKLQFLTSWCFTYEVLFHIHAWTVIKREAVSYYSKISTHFNFC